MAGAICLGMTLACSLLAMFAYIWGRELWGRRLALLSGLGAAGASVLLLRAILGDDFGLEYVASYSSKDLHPIYKLSVFWAGQQGSFLLWLFVHALTGCWLACKGRMESGGLAAYLLLQALLTVLVLGKSPFLPAAEFMEDGVGLNPLLQDPWMAVHPPIIFIGYALLAVPLAYSAGALHRNAGDASWLEPARKWTLWAWAFLGAGIFIGGYWAYKVLGWGGYWGWDPVENSSLVPWLLAAVLLHMLKLAKARPNVRLMAHLAAIFAYSFVLYGTFLTRSGILGDFSVHSFSGTSIGLLIAVVNAFVLLAALCQLIWRMKQLPQGEIYESYGSREFLLSLGMLLLVFMAVIVFLGMSMPLLTQLAGKPAAVDTGFYVRTMLPLGVAAMLALSLCSLRAYGGASLLEGRAGLKWLLALCFVLGAAISYGCGVRSLLPLLLGGAALLGAGASVLACWRHGLRRGAAIAHLGFALGLLAIVFSGSGSQSVSEEFQPGETKSLLGHEIIYKGQSYAEDGSSKSYVYEVDGEEVRALTKLHSNGSDAAREPAIAKKITGDIYIAPNPPQETGVEELTLKKKQIALAGELAYLFEEVEIEERADGSLKVTAEISVTDGDKVETVQPVIEISPNHTGRSEPVSVLEGAKRARLTGITEDYRKLRLEVLPSLAEAGAVPVTASVSTKPYIWLLWLSCLMVTLGSLLAARK
ncbi:MAG: cytochrome C biogenesis protein [Selenomonas ruminantium]|nr:cytochrome C biogenesis protein [Selenomonas ruminantium]